ncbi:two-component response regulator [Thioploca ingrica]|uniref:Two-component response regulator n=1 Tax=Thioploca ingrica TaxID=40754 RepID=A0A090ADY8_9GAMM|nr:two-component response regulator [Thioploca ingrica]
MDEIERQYSLLIVDDETEIGNTYRDYFVKRGFQVEIAGDGQEGLEKLRTGEFDVAIVDLLMPKMKGLDMIRQARKEGISTDMIILTAHGERDEAVESINLTVNGWFDKAGIQMETLLKKVRELCQVIPLDEIRRILSAIPE